MEQVLEQGLIRHPGGGLSGTASAGGRRGTAQGGMASGPISLGVRNDS